jgi:hypothetical protein
MLNNSFFKADDDVNEEREEEKTDQDLTQSIQEEKDDDQEVLEKSEQEQILNELVSRVVKNNEVVVADN